MGVPKFFRWLSERYPMCSQLVEQNKIPEFDNLYLDMNGIIHNCSHGNNDDVHYRISEEEIMKAVFSYIEHIFEKIRPQKLFFMALDGVAPRAKINQQRSRRFRTAQDAAIAIKKAIAKGEVLPEQEAFDSNCITPGTAFMDKLSDQLRYFVHKKMNADPQWRRCNIVLSSSDVPGEGEHKIMEYIRLARSQPDYDPNTRHVIYGLDADLIMLGLVTHDPHFCLLREEVVFGGQSRQKKNIVSNPSSQNFYLLHLSLLREYLDLEFSSLKNKLPFEYSIEKIIDDFVLMALFVGNDFIPHLPNMHINHGALKFMFNLYKIVLPTLDGYLNEDGKINLKNLEVLLTQLAYKEREIFEEANGDLFSNSGVDSRSGRVIKVLSPSQQELFERIKNMVKSNGQSQDLVLRDLNNFDRKFVTLLARDLNFYCYNSNVVDSRIIDKLVISEQSQQDSVNGSGDQDDSDEDEDVLIISAKLKPVLVDYIGVKSGSNGDGAIQTAVNEDESDSEDDEEGYLARLRVIKKYEQVYQAPDQKMSQQSVNRDKMIHDMFQSVKSDYYKGKMQIDINNNEQMKALRGSYIQGLQWIMHYYYYGVPSWGWFYPYHYAPMISDLVPNIQEAIDAVPQLELGAPFQPFEQLMGVLPARSVKLLPEAYRDLVLSADSPIIDFYPDEFETDLNGKKNDWEAVVKIPFVDEKRLQQAMKSKESHLKPDEVRRNSMGVTYQYRFDESKDPPGKYESRYQMFPALTWNKVVEEVFNLPTVQHESMLIHGLLDGVKLGADLMAGFPSLYTLDFSHFVAVHGVKVFQYPSKDESVVVRINSALDDHLTHEQIAHTYLGKRVQVDWPFLIEGVVVGVSDSVAEWTFAEEKPAHYFVQPLDQNQKLKPKDVKRTPHDQHDILRWERRGAQLEDQYSAKQACILGGVNCIVTVCVLRGMKRLESGALIKDYGRFQDSWQYPLQAIVFQVDESDTRFVEHPASAAAGVKDKSSSAHVRYSHGGSPTQQRSGGKFVPAQRGGRGGAVGAGRGRGGIQLVKARADSQKQAV
ncbi:hypothetical protein MP228_000128 [Amoeboaphelidium protococcarum]|nr:hypothetical protein MP228_000128 [Amoeboaphelidium protococcarum]